MNDLDRRMLERTLELAREGVAAGSSPIGCVIVDGAGKIVSEGRNHSSEPWPGPPQRIGNSGLAHAEMDAFFRIGKLDGAEGWTLYTSLEPCLMCGGAIGMLGLRRVVWACADPWGGSGRLIEWNGHPAYANTAVSACPFPDLEAEAAELFAPEAKKVYPEEGWRLWQARYPEIAAKYQDAPEEADALRAVQAEVERAPRLTEEGRA